MVLKAAASKLGKEVGIRQARAVTNLRELVKHSADPAEAAFKIETAAGGADKLAKLATKPLGGVAEFGLPFKIP